MKRSVLVKVPATSANLGPGFDVAGMALNIYCSVKFSLSGKELEIIGCPKEYANKNNLAYLGFVKTLHSVGKPVPVGLEIKIDSDIPVSRGLGSSSALIVAGICAADSLFDLKMNKMQMLSLATEVEGHPDNVAPCIFGGLVSSYVRNGECFEVFNSISDNLRFAVIIPSFEVSTEKARAILPENISRQDAVFNLAHFGLMISGFASGDERTLKEAFEDRIHQPYRKTLIPCFDTYRSLALACGALGFMISGSGSTMLIVGNDKTDFNAISNGVKDADFKLVFPCLEGPVCQTDI